MIILNINPFLMTDYIAFPKPKALVKLTGIIKQLKVERGDANFLATLEEDALGEKLSGIGAILGALAGSGGAAMTAASHNQGEAEAADYVTFELDDKHIKGWVKYCPFKNGDQVEIVADDKGDYWMVYAIARPSDRMLAILPHCGRSKSKHLQAMVKRWLLWGGGLVIFFCVPAVLSVEGVDGLLRIPFWILTTSLMAFFGLFCRGMISKFMPFALFAEKIFQILGLPNPEDVDLRETSKRQRTEADRKWLGIGKEFGKDYFKY